jgi:hypothetical protein
MADSVHRSTAKSSRLVKGLFFFGYLAFQIVYPALPWFGHGYDRFTWHMYAGLREEPRFTVIFASGSRTDVGDPLKVGSAVRLLGSSVDQRRVLPPWLCANWDGAATVIARYQRTGREEVHQCSSARR